MEKLDYFYHMLRIKITIKKIEEKKSEIFNIFSSYTIFL